jgi:hypothetical protein
MVGKRRTKDVATDEPNEDATTEGQRTLYGFRAVYVFDRLSRDLWPSFCALDGIREGQELHKSLMLLQDRQNLPAENVHDFVSHFRLRNKFVTLQSAGM